MNKIVGILGVGVDGGTFLDWSLHYLSGDTYMYHSPMLSADNPTNWSFSKVRIIDNPIIPSRKVAHRHLKNHPRQHTIDMCIDKMLEIDDDEINLSSFYSVIDGTNTEDAPYDTFISERTDKYPNIKFIALYADNESYIHLYNRILIFLKSTKPTEPLPPMSNYGISLLTDSPNRKMLNISDMYYNLDNVILSLMEWANLPVKTDRLSKWKSIYTQWKEMLPKSN